MLEASTPQLGQPSAIDMEEASCNDKRKTCRVDDLEEEEKDFCGSDHVLDVVITRNSCDAIEAERHKLDSYRFGSDIQQKKSAESVKVSPNAAATMVEEDDDKFENGKSQPTIPDSATSGAAVMGFADGGSAHHVVQVHSPQAIQPGAIAEDGPGIHHHEEEDDSSSSTNSPSIGSEMGGGLMAVADLVESPHDLPHAQEISSNNVTAANRRDNSNKSGLLNTKITLWVGVAIVALVAISAALLAGLVISRNEEQFDSDIIIGTSPPSLTPSMSLDGYLLSLLLYNDDDSDDTVGVLLNDPDSPQSKAYQWLLEDSPENLRSYSDDRIRQKYSLAVLYYSTSGNTWNENTNWLNHSVHECSWYGKPDFAMKAPFSQGYPGYLAGFLEPPPVTRCNANGIHQHLWLDQNNLQGSLPPEIYWLTNLQTLSVGLNKLTGTLSSHIGRMTELEGLAIFSSSIESTIPTQIGLLSNVKALALFKNVLHGSIPSELWELSSLTDVVMGDNDQLHGTLPSDIGAFSNLRFILFNNCNLTGMSQDANTVWKKIENRLDADALGTQLTDNFVLLLYSGTIPSELGQILSLEWLVLYSNYLTGTIPSELGELSELSLLSLRSNDLHGTIPKQLGNLSSLFLLYLHNNTLTGEIPSYLGLLLKLELPLNLGNNHLTGTMPSQIGLLTVLQGLELSNNQITGVIPSEVALLTSIGRLTFANNFISGTVPQELSSLQQSLYMLSLEGNELLSGTIPDSLCTINGTCMPSASFSKLCPEPLGLSFECSSALCGCNCSCEPT